MDLAIALDIGHSAVKGRAARLDAPGDRVSINFPTCVDEAIAISDDATRVQADRETVEVAGKKYFFGATAMKQGSSRSFVGQNKDWVFTAAHDVLLLGGVKTILAKFDEAPARIVLVLGLPAENFNAHKDELQKRALELVSSYLGAATTSVRVKIQPQPYGALQNIIFLPTGEVNTRTDVDKQTWGVIEIGHYTTDYLLSEEGDMVQRAFGSSEGVSAVYNRLEHVLADKKLNTSLKSIHQAVTTGVVRNYGQEVDVSKEVQSIVEPFARKLIDDAKRRFGQSLSDMHGIFIAGGGAEVPAVYDLIHAEFPHAIKTGEPQYSVAEGFTRLALFVANNQA
ncbi:ParM/StbA family protein [Burkholderia gladioli]|uniref:Actin-like protein N-terminal domain-containing protein n=1 Tax=Burkholderia gladioli (strain BSR3) TaxID=999541 RepID=F2LSJ8_BURGS|nr:ParM/StbA family protein [Burkholderia gladioli]AEA65794.1 hypothetical protein bgla_3p0930 [Burkholderia gladioli BSR3]